MMYVYLTKDLGIIPGGQVERVSDAKAAQLILGDAAEAFDPRKHGNKPGAPRLAERRPSKMVTK